MALLRALLCRLYPRFHACFAHYIDVEVALIMSGIQMVYKRARDPYQPSSARCNLEPCSTCLSVLRIVIILHAAAKLAPAAFGYTVRPAIDDGLRGLHGIAE